MGSIRTNWGTFEDHPSVDFEVCPEATHESGYEFRQGNRLVGAGANFGIRFEPSRRVDADELVFVQAISAVRSVPAGGGRGTTYAGGAVEYRNDQGQLMPDTQDASRIQSASGRADRNGAYIDTDGRETDPAYGGMRRHAPEGMPSEDVDYVREMRRGLTPGMASPGTRASDGTWQGPSMEDHPFWMPPRGTNVSGTRYEFETTVMARGGRMDGHYLGSVQWGFHASGNRVQEIPLQLRSVGTPTAFFMDAARQWNEGHAHDGADSEQLEIAQMSSDEIIDTLRRGTSADNAERLVQRLRDECSVEVEITCDDTSDQMSADEIDVQLSGGGGVQTWRRSDETFNDSGGDRSHTYRVSFNDLLPGSPAQVARLFRADNRLVLSLYNGEVTSHERMGNGVSWDWSHARSATITDGESFTYRASIRRVEGAAAQ